MDVRDIEPEAFHKLLGNGLPDDSMLLDIREPEEWEYYRLDEAVHMPMNTIPVRLQDIPQDSTVYVMCAHGVRSRMVAHYLADRGYERIVNVEGGISALAALRGFAYD